MKRRSKTSRAPSRPEFKLAVEYWLLDRLIPSPRNARSHSDAQVAEIAGSIRAFGFSNPILLGDDGDIVAGHGRLAAARKLGLAEVPVIVLKGLTEFQRRQLVLADNRIALNAGWDPEMLKLELQDLKGLGADLSILGFTKEELSQVLNGEPVQGLTDEDQVPEIVEAAVTRGGDTWCLGEHRIICGDSTDSACVEALLRGAVPQLMVTDPPYGVDYDPAWRHRAGVNRSRRTGKIANDQRADWGQAWALFPGDVAYVWHGALHATTVAKSLEACGFSIRAQIVWGKTRLVIGRGDYHWQHEPCWYAVRNQGHWAGDRKQTTLWTVSSGHQDTDTVHGTQKPVECMRRPIINNSLVDQFIYDPFLGSGTTVIAAETVRRKCLGLEIDPLYVDVAVRRWQTFTGSTAILAGDGRSFDEITSTRLAKPAMTPDSTTSVESRG